MAETLNEVDFTQKRTRVLQELKSLVFDDPAALEAILTGKAVQVELTAEQLTRQRRKKELIDLFSGIKDKEFEEIIFAEYKKIYLQNSTQRERLQKVVK